MSDARVVAERLGKRYRTQRGRGDEGPWIWALRDVSFEVGPGEVLGVVGANGAGKSTLLRMVGGLGRPSEGRVSVDGRIGALLELGAGFFGDLTGRENALLSGVVSGLLRREVEERMDDIVAFAGLTEFIDEPVRRYSSGMSIRLAFSVAVHVEPEILLVDEFLSVGDLAFQAKCLDRIQEMRSSGCAIILVSHGMGSIRDLCHRAIWLRAGRVHAQGAAREVAEEYETEMRRTTLELTPDDEVTELPGGSRLETKKNRFGSGEVRITEVRLSPGPVMTSRGPLAVEIDFDARQPVVSPVFVVSVRRVSGSVCVDLNTQTSKAAVPDLSGPGTIRLELDRLDLARGDYRVSVGVFPPDWAHAYDFHWASYPLKVQGPSGGKGVLAPRASWIFVEPEAPSGPSFGRSAGPEDEGDQGGQET